MKTFFCLSKVLMHKSGVKGTVFSVCLLPLILCLSACPTGHRQDNVPYQKPTPQPTPSPKPPLQPEREREREQEREHEHENKHENKAELETIREEEVLGTYEGDISVLMDGVPLGPYRETVKIKKKPLGDISFVSERTIYKDMRVDIGYVFETTTSPNNSSFTLTRATDGKSFTFNGQKGTLRFYTRNDYTSKPLERFSDTSIKGSIYKKKGKIYISFSVQYDAAAIREAFPLIPQGTHNKLSSVMKDGTKKQ